MKKVRYWVQETIESGRFVETSAMSEGGAEILAKHLEQAEILDCSEYEIAYARISDKYKTVQRDLNTAKALNEKLETAIRETIEDNLHLADGEICTLIKLKRAIGYT